MADKRHHPSDIDMERARELLSPYLDNEVTSDERALVEEALASSAELRREVETLRQTVALLKALPPIAAPRPFTLSEADVKPPVQPRRTGFFGLPNWLGGLVALAATLICVVAIGGYLLTQQMGGRAPAAPAELAAAPTAPPTSTTATEIQPQAAPAQPESEEKRMMATEATAEQETEAPALKQEITEEAATPVEEPAAAASMAASPETARNAAPEGAAGKAAVESQALETAPVPTPTSSPTSVAAMAAPAQESAKEEATAQDNAQPPAAAPGIQSMEERGAPRRVEISDLKLELRPGRIEVAGNIPVEPGTVLRATLERNGAPFEAWADPATLETVVQPGGYFSMTIRANPNQPDQNLVTAGPANYRIILTSEGAEAPVTASVFFETFNPPATEVPPTVTSTPSPTSTATSIPSPTPTDTSTPTPTMEPTPTPTEAALLQPTPLS